MSVLSQFFTQGSGASGFIDVETLILSGGGGGGTNPYALCGNGGGGAVYYGVLSIVPGSSCPIVVGGGGALGNPSPYTPAPGNNGGQSSFTTPIGTIRVAGGGGGAGSSPNVGNTGGTGGGGSALSASRSKPLSVYTTGYDKFTLVNSGPPVTPNTPLVPGQGNPVGYKNGAYYGYPGMGGIRTGPGAVQFSSAAGGAGSAAIQDEYAPSPSPTPSAANGQAFYSDITGTTTGYGAGGGGPTVNLGGGGVGNGGAPTGSGGSGVVIIRYPTAFGASTFSPVPAATDLSPATPGFRTYRITASATVTLP